MDESFKFPIADLGLWIKTNEDGNKFMYDNPVPDYPKQIRAMEQRLTDLENTVKWLASLVQGTRDDD